jgi:hypothetical protein
LIIWISRILIIIVLLDNLQAAIQFTLTPEKYAPAFDLTGAAGLVATISIGILFLMWCVPYVFAAVHPIRYRISLIEACIMQSVGLIGESILLWNLPSGLEMTPASIQRFVIFDAVGLVLLLAALFLTVHVKTRNRRNSP